jgi:hypothetical protein
VSGSSVGTEPAFDDFAAREADQVKFVTACPGCGYPTFGPDLCAYCRPADLGSGRPLGLVPPPN